VAEIAAATRRDIAYVPVPLEEFVADARAHDVPEEVVGC
jgi:hypothetical protein